MLVGAVTVLIALIAVFLAYNANGGLPFVPTKELKVDIANGSNLVVGNDVREGGFRVGVVYDIKPIELPSGQTGAQLILHLDKARSRVPVDSKAAILPQSVLGTEVPVADARQFKPLDSPTAARCRLGRRPCRCSSTTCSRRLTRRRGGDPGEPGRRGRRADRARVRPQRHDLELCPTLFGHLQPVATYLSDPKSQLIPFF